MTYITFLMVSRLIIHFLTLVYILKYSQGQGRYKFGASLSAALIAASSAALGMQILTRWHELHAGEPMPWLPILCAVFLYKLWKADGNVARMFPRKVGQS